LESFGRYLVQQRELRGLTAEDVVRVTKLSPVAVRSLESDRFDQLPGRTFVVGYLRAYATCVGLNPDEVVLRWEEHVGSMPPSAEDEAPRMSLKGAAGPMPIRWVFAGAIAAVAGVALWLILG